MFYIKTQQNNIREGNSYFLKYIISISKSSLNTIKKLEPFGKIRLYVIAQG